MLLWSWLAGLSPEVFGAWPGHGTSLAQARQTLFSEDQSLSLCPALKQVGNRLGLKSGQKAENQGQTRRTLLLSLSWHGRFSLMSLLPPLLVQFIRSRQDNPALSLPNSIVGT